MPASKSHFPRLLQAISEQVWLLEEDRWEAMLEIVEHRIVSGQLEAADLQARLATGTTRRDRNSDVRNYGHGVGVIEVNGMIAPRMNMFNQLSGGVSAEGLSHAIDAAVSDDELSKVVMRFDTPGGAAMLTPETAAKIFAARGKKRFVAMVDPYCASGGYYLASACEEVVITSSGMAGSVGVLSAHVDTTAMDERLGLKRTVFRIPAGKAEGSFGEALTDAAKQHHQQVVTQIYETFVADVAKYRGVTAAAVKAGFGQGRTLRAEDAVAAGLADRIATFEELIAELSSSASRGARGGHPAVTTQETKKMDPLIHEAMIRRGLCGLTDSEDHRKVVLATFFRMQGEKMPELSDVAAVVAALDKKAASQPLAQPLAQSPETAGSDAVSHEDILATCGLAALDADAKLALIESLTKDRATLTHSAMVTRINDQVAAVNKPAGTQRIEGVSASRDRFMVEARDAILLREWGAENEGLPSQILNQQTRQMEDWKPAAGAMRNRDLSSYLKVAEQCLIMDGYDRQQIANLEDMDIAQLALGVANPHHLGIRMADGQHHNTSGMFPNLLYDAMNVMLRRSYNEAPTTFQIWMRRAADLKDFRLTNKVIAGELSDPSFIPEDGEFDEVGMLDGKESYKLGVWGFLWSITWQAIVNDSQGAFTESPTKMGRAMRRKQNRLAYQRVKDNNAMADGVAFFNATAQASGGHGNLTTGSATPTVDVLNAMKVKMRKLRGLNTATDGSGPLNVQPKWAVCGSLLGPVFEELLRSHSRPDAGGSNPGSSGVANIWKDRLTVVSDAELDADTTNGSDTRWDLYSDHRDMEHFEYAYLRGMQTPRVDMQPSFTRLGQRIRMYQAFQVHGTEYRGGQRHNGA